MGTHNFAYDNIIVLVNEIVAVSIITRGCVQRTRDLEQKSMKENNNSSRIVKIISCRYQHQLSCLTLYKYHFICIALNEKQYLLVSVIV